VVRGRQTLRANDATVWSPSALRAANTFKPRPNERIKFIGNFDMVVEGASDSFYASPSAANHKKARVRIAVKPDAQIGRNTDYLVYS
jgi:hypothetical protein